MLSIRYGIPAPGIWEPDIYPEFRQEGVSELQLDSFPPEDLPSGGMSSRISPSEMFLVIAETDCPRKQIRMKWTAPGGKVISDTRMSGTWAYEFLGRFPWEIWDRGTYRVEVSAGKEKETIIFEVL